ncbi:hypothetical protein [Kitasatospora sp. NPDC091207]|uniref:hypothetical protein n=1 Tax=Kitasatospora sp. NPDC091207 TaxID=3364083 RepID=UPI00381F9B16
MSAPARDPLARLWDEHVRTPFPPHLRGRVVEGEDMVLLDAYLAGGVSSSLSGSLDEKRHQVLVTCLADVGRVLPSIGDEDGVRYFERLRDMAVLAIGLGPSTMGRDPR